MNENHYFEVSFEQAVSFFLSWFLCLFLWFFLDFSHREKVELVEESPPHEEGNQAALAGPSDGSTVHVVDDVDNVDHVDTNAEQDDK